MERIALFPGSYDPLTFGHIELVNRALKLFDKIIIGIGRNPQKSAMFPIETRLRWVSHFFEKYANVSVKEYNMLTVEFAM